MTQAELRASDCASGLCRTSRSWQESGFSLTEILVAMGIASAVGLGVTTIMDQLGKTEKKVASLVATSSMGLQVQRAVSCNRTFQGRPQGNPCANNSYVSLLNENGDRIVDQNGSRMGDWTLRAKCNATAGSIELRAAKLMPGAPVVNFPIGPGQYNPDHYRPDEVGGINQANGRELRYDWDHPRSLLLPIGQGAGLCSSSFAARPPTATARCPAGSVLRGIDFMTQALDCQSLSAIVPTCSNANGLALKFMNGQWVCAKAMTDATLDTMARTQVRQQIPLISTQQTNLRINAVVPGIINAEISRNNQQVVVPGDSRIVSQSNQFTSQKFNNMVNGTRRDYIQSSDSACALFNNTKCPDGWFAYGVENRMPTVGNNCRIRCQKIQ